MSGNVAGDDQSESVGLGPAPSATLNKNVARNGLSGNVKPLSATSENISLENKHKRNIFPLRRALVFFGHQRI